MQKPATEKEWRGFGGLRKNIFYLQGGVQRSAVRLYLIKLFQYHLISTRLFSLVQGLVGQLI